jgi:ABC-type multidrug transport system ATPase subunit
VEAMCDRVIFIKAGKIQRDDSVENITKSSSMEEAFRLATAD